MPSSDRRLAATSLAATRRHVVNICGRAHTIYTMELSFNALKKLQVIDLNDGKNLGRVCDITFFYPENRIKGFTVTGGRGWRLFREEVFIPLQRIAKIGADVIFVRGEVKGEGGGPPPKPGHPHCPPEPPYGGRRRDFDDME